MRLEKRIVFVGPEPVRVRLAETLRDRDYELIPCAPTEDFDAFLTKNHDSGAVIIDESVGEPTGAQIIKHVRESQPGVPVAWRADVKRSLGLFGMCPPHRVFQGFPEVEALDTELRHLLRLSTYPAPIIQALCDAATHTLLEGFGSELAVERVFVKTTRNPLATSNSVLPFAGAEMSGFVLVQSNAAPLESILAKVLPDEQKASVRKLEDMIGEMSNQIAGALKPFFSANGFDITSGTPILCRGSDFVLWGMASPTSIVATLTHPAGPVHVQLNLEFRGSHTFHGSVLDSREGPTGEIAFF